MSLLDTPLVTSNQQIGWSLTCERDWQISLRNVLNDEGNVAAKIRLFAFLKNCPGVGAVGARTLLRALGLSETRTIRSLGPVQKARILTALEMIAAIPIINADGSITTPAGGGEQAVSGASKDSGNTEFAGDTKPAGNVTQDDIDKVLDKVNEAVSKGDGTLTGDAGKDVVNKVTDNASKAPAADKEKVEEKKDAATDSAVKADDKKTDATKPSTGSGSAPSKSDSKPSSGSSSKPSHEHTWQAQYRNDPVYETRTRTVVDQDAWDEQVCVGSHIVFSDGAIFYDAAAAANYQESKAMAGTPVSYYTVDDYKTVHHEAVTHQETYQVQTGTKQVLTGYRCSGCGATK